MTPEVILRSVSSSEDTRPNITLVTVPAAPTEPNFPQPTFGAEEQAPVADETSLLVESDQPLDLEISQPISSYTEMQSDLKKYFFGRGEEYWCHLDGVTETPIDANEFFPLYCEYRTESPDTEYQCQATYRDPKYPGIEFLTIRISTANGVHEDVIELRQKEYLCVAPTLEAFTIEVFGPETEDDGLHVLEITANDVVSYAVNREQFMSQIAPHMEPHLIAKLLTGHDCVKDIITTKWAHLVQYDSLGNPRYFFVPAVDIFARNFIGRKSLKTSYGYTETTPAFIEVRNLMSQDLRTLIETDQNTNILNTLHELFPDDQQLIHAQDIQRSVDQESLRPHVSAKWEQQIRAVITTRWDSVEPQADPETAPIDYCFECYNTLLNHLELYTSDPSRVHTHAFWGLNPEVFAGISLDDVITRTQELLYETLVSKLKVVLNMQEVLKAVPHDALGIALEDLGTSKTIIKRTPSTNRFKRVLGLKRLTTERVPIDFSAAEAIVTKILHLDANQNILTTREELSHDQDVYGIAIEQHGFASEVRRVKAEVIQFLNANKLPTSYTMNVAVSPYRQQQMTYNLTTVPVWTAIPELWNKVKATLDAQIRVLERKELALRRVTESQDDNDEQIKKITTATLQLVSWMDTISDQEHSEDEKRTRKHTISPEYKAQLQIALELKDAIIDSYKVTISEARAEEVATQLDMSAVVYTVLTHAITTITTLEQQAQQIIEVAHEQSIPLAIEQLLDIPKPKVDEKPNTKKTKKNTPVTIFPRTSPKTQAEKLTTPNLSTIPNNLLVDYVMKDTSPTIAKMTVDEKAELILNEFKQRGMMADLGAIYDAFLSLNSTQQLSQSMQLSFVGVLTRKRADLSARQLGLIPSVDVIRNLARFMITDPGISGLLRTKQPIPNDIIERIETELVTIRGFDTTDVHAAFDTLFASKDEQPAKRGKRNKRS